MKKGQIVDATDKFTQNNNGSKPEPKKSEQLNQAEKDVVRDIIQRRAELEKKVAEMQQTMLEGGYFNRQYKEGEQAEVDPHFLQTLQQFLAHQEEFNYKIQEIVGQLMTMLNAMVADNYVMSIQLLEVHKSNVDNGKTEEVSEKTPEKKNTISTPKKKGKEK